jgi:hypothetical protein
MNNKIIKNFFLEYSQKLFNLTPSSNISQNLQKPPRVIESPSILNRIINLTPHNISIYNKDEKHAIDILPEKKKYQLRLVNKNMEKENSADVILSVNSTRIITSITEPIYYDTVEGIDELPDYYKNWDIITSPMVAEYIMKNQNKYKNKCRNIFTPDTDPKSVVRDESGKIIGIKRLVFYGCLYST